MSNMLRSLNHLLVLLTCAASLWAWVNLPEMERYPVHWNARGEADGFSSKVGVAVVLCFMPLTALFTHGLMWGLTKVKAIKESVEKSRIVYDLTWQGCLWLYLIMNIVIASVYLRLVSGDPASFDSDLMLRVLPVAMGIFFIILGNVLAKARQNKFVGVKTSWTLKSKSTWDATHRMTARLWVGGGVVMMLAPFILSGGAAIALLVTVIMLISFAPIIYSYVYYQSASDKPD